MEKDLKSKMSNALEVKVTARKGDGQEWWEGTVTLDGVKPTKLTRKSDGMTRFTTKSAVQGAARRFAERYGYSGADFGTEAKPAVKKAAKRSAKPATPISNEPPATESTN
jgi:hypothetical protein